MRYLAKYQDFPYRKGVKATSLVLSSREGPLSAGNNCLGPYNVALSEEPGTTEQKSAWRDWSSFHTIHPTAGLVPGTGPSSVHTHWDVIAS